MAPDQVHERRDADTERPRPVSDSVHELLGKRASMLRDLRAITTHTRQIEWECRLDDIAKHRGKECCMLLVGHAAPRLHHEIPEGRQRLATQRLPAHLRIDL